MSSTIIKTIAHTAATIAHTAATIAHTAAMVASHAAILVVTAAQWLWNAAMTANPIGLIIVGIAALGAAVWALWENWSTVTGFFKELWGNIIDIFEDSIKWILFALFPGPMLIKENWGTLTKFFASMWDGIKDAFSSAWDWIKQYVIDPLLSIPQTIKDAWEDAFGFIGKAGGVLGDIGGGIGGAVGKLKFWQHGGTITEPTLMYGLRSMKPYAVAGEAGIEHVVPDSQMGGGGFGIANIIVELDGTVLAELLGQPLVDLIRVRTGAGV